MEKKLLVLCDPEADYIQLLGDFFQKQSGIPWKIRIYTNVEVLIRERPPAELLLISAVVYRQLLPFYEQGRLIMLGVPDTHDEKCLAVDKYQPAMEVYRYVLTVYSKITKSDLLPILFNEKCLCLAVYSPIKRILQTSFALTMAQILAEKHRVLYLNMESYSGYRLTEEQDGAVNPDLADLLYFCDVGDERFRLRHQIICQKCGALSYIPPMKSGRNLITVTASQWIKLLSKLQELGEYEFLVLDLSDQIQGLFDILKMSKRIFSPMKQDEFSIKKVKQYKQLLKSYGYEDICNKTTEVAITQQFKIPMDPLMLSQGPFADFVRGYIGDFDNE